MSQSQTQTNKTDLAEDDGVVLNLIFLYVVFILGAVLRHLAVFMKIPVPYTVMVFALGIVIGSIVHELDPSTDYLMIGPHTQLQIFMPILIFEGAFAMDVYVFRKVFWQSLLLAGPGLVVMIFMTAAVAKIVLQWGWYWALIFGAVVSATDPVAVVALLKDIGASQHLSLLIEGESLLNDGTAIVAFNAVIRIVTNVTKPEVGSVLGLLLQFALGGPAFGYLVAHASIFWLSKTFNDPLSEIAVTVLAAYLTFFVSETMLEVSGVLALVVLGIVLSNNRTSISPEVEEFLHSFWETLAYLANTLIFFLVGMTIVQAVGTELGPYDFFYLALFYICVNAIRGLTIIMFSPIMRRIGYGLPWQYTIVATWSGLRGAVGLAMALIVYKNEYFQEDKHIMTISYKILFYLSGIVFTSLVINATTISKLLALLGMSGISNARRASMKTALSYMEDSKLKTVSIWKSDRFLCSVDWEFVDEQCSVKDPFHEDMTKEEQESIIDLTERVWAQCPNCGVAVPYQPTEKELADMTAEAIIRLIKAERLSYWRQFEQGMLATEALRRLTELCDIAADKRAHHISVDAIKEQWKYPRLYQWLEWVKRLDIPVAYMQKSHFNQTFDDREESHGKMSLPLKLLTRRWLVTSVAIVLFLLLDAPLMALSLAVETGSSDVDSASLVFMDLVILLLITAYFLLRVAVLKKVYIRTPWFWLSIIIIVHGVIDDIILSTVPREGNETLRIAFICMRMVRQLHALEAFIPLIILLLENALSKHLSNGYDVGRGFVLGEEEVRNVIDLMSDRREIVEQLRTHSDNAKFEILKCLGLLQKQHPEVAMGVKTHRAIRGVLNQLRTSIHTLLQEGVLEEAEGAELELIIESRMKKLLTAPPRVPLPSIEKILRNVPWIGDDEKLVQFIKSRARLVNYEYGQEMMQQGEPTTGMSIILSGLVKLEMSASVVSRTGQQDQVTRILDFLTSGNVLGEMGVLTGNPRSATVKCETAVQVLELDIKDVNEAFEEFSQLDPPLKIRLWRLGAVRLATVLVMDKPAFQALTKEQIRMLLECGSVYEVDVRDGATQFVINASLVEVVLLFGTAYDSYTKEKYIGPSYIPSKTQRLNFEPTDGPNPVLFILPRNIMHGEVIVPRPSGKVEGPAPPQTEFSEVSRLCHSVINMPYGGDVTVSASAITTDASVRHKISVINRAGKRGSYMPQKGTRISYARLKRSLESAFPEEPTTAEAHMDDGFQVHGGDTSPSVETASDLAVTSSSFITSTTGQTSASKLNVLASSGIVEVAESAAPSAKDAPDVAKDSPTESHKEPVPKCNLSGRPRDSAWETSLEMGACQSQSRASSKSNLSDRAQIRPMASTVSDTALNKHHLPEGVSLRSTPSRTDRGGSIGPGGLLSRNTIKKVAPQILGPKKVTFTRKSVDSQHVSASEPDMHLAHMTPGPILSVGLADDKLSGLSDGSDLLLEYKDDIRPSTSTKSDSTLPRGMHGLQDERGKDSLKGFLDKEISSDRLERKTEEDTTPSSANSLDSARSCSSKEELVAVEFIRTPRQSDSPVGENASVPGRSDDETSPKGFRCPSSDRELDESDASWRGKGGPGKRSKPRPESSAAQDSPYVSLPSQQEANLAEMATTTGATSGTSAVAAADQDRSSGGRFEPVSDKGLPEIQSDEEEAPSESIPPYGLMSSGSIWRLETILEVTPSHLEKSTQSVGTRQPSSCTVSLESLLDGDRSPCLSSGTIQLTDQDIAAKSLRVHTESDVQDVGQRARRERECADKSWVVVQMEKMMHDETAAEPEKDRSQKDVRVAVTPSRSAAGGSRQESVASMTGFRTKTPTTSTGSLGQQDGMRSVSGSTTMFRHGSQRFSGRFTPDEVMPHMGSITRIIPDGWLPARRRSIDDKSSQEPAPPYGSSRPQSDDIPQQRLATPSSSTTRFPSIDMSGQKPASPSSSFTKITPRDKSDQRKVTPDRRHYQREDLSSPDDIKSQKSAFSSPSQTDITSRDTRQQGPAASSLSSTNIPSGEKKSKTRAASGTVEPAVTPERSQSQKPASDVGRPRLPGQGPAASSASSTNIASSEQKSKTPAASPTVEPAATPEPGTYHTGSLDDSISDTGFLSTLQEMLAPEVKTRPSLTTKKADGASAASQKTKYVVCDDCSEKSRKSTPSPRDQSSSPETRGVTDKDKKEPASRRRRRSEEKHKKERKDGDMDSDSAI